MPVNQPPIKQDQAEASWDLEVTQTVNRLETQLTSIDLGSITPASIGAVASTRFNGRLPRQILSGTDSTVIRDPGLILTLRTISCLIITFGHTDYAVLYNIIVEYN